MTVWDAQYRQGRVIRRWPSEAMLGFLARRSFPSRSRLLELGCGAGGNLRPLWESDYTAIGIDPSPEAIRLAQRQRHYVPPWVGDYERMPEWWVGWEGLLQADARDLPFKAESFDAVVEVTMLQHLPVPDKQQVLREARRDLKPGGWFFSQHLAYGTTNYEGIFPGNPPVYFWDPTTARLDLEAAGFSIAYSYHLRREYPGVGEAVYLVTEAQAR